jgi:hypothetical protein
MNKQQEESLEILADIRSLMDKSTRFLSLSGWSGISAGLAALIGSGLLFWYQNQGQDSWTYTLDSEFGVFALIDAILVLGFSLLMGSWLTIREARKQGQPLWGPASRQLLRSLFVPLVAGGIFCAALALHQQSLLILPATLLFYGISLVSASKYTLDELRYLGYIQIGLGLLSSFLSSYGLVFWAFGFGVLHIIYGAYMYKKYNLKS